jgi:hypothetical protein
MAALAAAFVCSCAGEPSGKIAQSGALFGALVRLRRATK